VSNLPSPEEQEWLLDSLAHLLFVQGEHPFVGGPLRYPTEADFPDPWNGDLASLKRLSLRILGYAGMEGFDVRLERFEGERHQQFSATGDVTYRHEGAAAWFAGIDRKTVRFGCSDHQLEEAGEGLVGVMAHEVAHAYRAAHGLVVDDHDLEEHLTDLTTVYLGFGIFTVNNTYRFRSYTHGDLGSGYSTSRAGYLSAQAMSYLFAAQILCRELSCWEAWQLLRWIEPRQRGHVKAALRALRPAGDLWARLRPALPQIALGSQTQSNRPEV
jgi:hypothetical protein